MLLLFVVLVSIKVLTEARVLIVGTSAATLLRVPPVVGLVTVLLLVVVEALSILAPFLGTVLRIVRAAC